MIHFKNIISCLLIGNIFLLVFSCNSYKIQTHESTNQLINDKINPKEFSDVNLSLYRDSLENEMDEVINQANRNLDVGTNILKFSCTCSKGTYIRALARDIGAALNSGAHLIKLRRIRSGNFSIEQAKSVVEWVDIIETS